MNIEPTSRQYIVRQLAKEFRFNGGELATALGAVAEHIRSSCALLGVGDDGVGLGSSSIVKICRTTHRRLYPLFNELLLDSDSVTAQLSNLDRLRDVVKISSSQAIIGPARRIYIDDKHALLIGGGPVSALPSAMRGLVEVAGRSRIVAGTSEVSSLNSIPFQRLEDWLELERDDMFEWANLFIKAKLKTERNILVPDDLVLWFRFRWVAIAELIDNCGVYLARRKIALFGNLSLEYSLIRLRKSGATQKIDAFVSIERECARKLQGLLRRGDDGLERLKFSIVREGVVELVLNHPLANCHEKILALGWNIEYGSDTARWPKKFEFSQKMVPLLRRAFSLIGYDLIEK